MKRSALVIFTTVFVLAAVVTGGLYWRWVNSPRYALQQMVLAIQTQNMDKFFKYVDLQEIAANLVEASSDDLRPPSKPDMDYWERLSRGFGKKVARAVVPRLMERYEQQVKNAIQSYLMDLTNTQVVALAAAATTAQIQTRGEAADVTLRDPKTGEPLRFMMVRDPATQEWRISAISYEDLKRLLKRELL
jgi:hypothetical protein